MKTYDKLIYNPLFTDALQYQQSIVLLVDLAIKHVLFRDSFPSPAYKVSVALVTDKRLQQAGVDYTAIPVLQDEYPADGTVLAAAFHLDLKVDTYSNGNICLEIARGPAGEEFTFPGWAVDPRSYTHLVISLDPLNGTLTVLDSRILRDRYGPVYTDPDHPDRKRIHRNTKPRRDGTKWSSSTLILPKSEIPGCVVYDLRKDLAPFEPNIDQLLSHARKRAEDLREGCAVIVSKADAAYIKALYMVDIEPTGPVPFDEMFMLVVKHKLAEPR